MTSALAGSARRRHLRSATAGRRGGGAWSKGADRPRGCAGKLRRLGNRRSGEASGDHAAAEPATLRQNATVLVQTNWRGSPTKVAPMAFSTVKPLVRLGRRSTLYLLKRLFTFICVRNP